MEDFRPRRQGETAGVAEMTGEQRAFRVAVVAAVDVSVRTLLVPQIEAFSKAGYEVSIVCSNGPGVLILRARGLKVETVTILRHISPWRDLMALLQLYRLFLSQRYDIVHTHTPKASFLAQVAAWLAHVPVRVNTVHGFYFYGQPSSLKRMLFRYLEVLTCRLSSHVFSQSWEDVEMVKRARLFSSAKLEWLGNGIDLERFNPSRFPPETRRQVRREIDLPEDAFVVGIVARIVREKGFHELFEAFNDFCREVPHAYLVCVGFIDQSRGAGVTPADAEKYGIGPRCRFLGERDDVERLLTAMDLFVLPSHREGYPRSVMEANAMGLPAIVTDIRGCREVVLDQVNGIIVPVGRPDSLAWAMKRIYDDGELRNRLAHGARQRAGEMFNEQRVFEVILSTYARLLSGVQRGKPTDLSHRA